MAGKQTIGSILDNRSFEVLRVIVKNYVRTAEPVGSRTVSKESSLGLSPATIRNVMSDLEDIGLLEQPHTSAGRVPTDQAYRLYVDHLASLPELSKDEVYSILRLYEKEGRSLPKVLETTAQVLASLSNQAGLVLTPSLSLAVVSHMEFVRVRKQQVLAIIATESGLVQSRVVDLDEDIPPERLEAIGRYMNEQFAGKTLRAIREKVLEEMSREKEQYDSLLQEAIELSEKVLADSPGEEEIFVGGTMNLMDQPELAANVEKMKTLFKAFEEKSQLIRILDGCIASDGITVWIGSESNLRAIEDFSLITHPYHAGDRVMGVLGIIGPKRMEYPRIISVVHHTAKIISDLLAEKP